MLPQLVDNWLPIWVSLIATQKTNATRRTIRVYSTRPWPSSSTINLLKSSILLHPLSLRKATKFVLICRYRTSLAHSRCLFQRMWNYGQHVPCHGRRLRFLRSLRTFFPFVPANLWQKWHRHCSTCQKLRFCVLNKGLHHKTIEFSLFTG